MKPRIAVIGSANVDFIMQVDHLPAVDETVIGGIFMQTFGGKGANQAVAAARAGGEVTFISAVGNDPYAALMRENFARDGIDITHVAEHADVASGAALVMFDGTGHNYLTVAPGSNARVTKAKVEAAEEAIRTADWVVLQQEIPLEANETALALAARHDRPVLFNYAPAHDLRLRPGPAIHGLVVNEVEAAALAETAGKIENPAQAAEAAQLLLARGGHRWVILTMGGQGAVMADTEGTVHIPAAACEPVDATAAGDTFCGALAVALGEGRALAQAARFATAAAALAVSQAGAQPSIPTRPAIDAAVE